MKDILAYLFGGSQQEQLVEGLLEDLDAGLQAAELEGRLQSQHKPLAALLKSLGVPSADLELHPEGFKLTCTNGDDYRRYCQVLSQPEAMEKLAEGGWVVHHAGDVAMTNEPAEYTLTFLDFTTASDTSKEAEQSIADIVKKGREFATTPFEPSDSNPVEHPEAPNKQQAGVGKAKDGAAPKGKIKDSVNTDEPERYDAIVEKIARMPGRPKTVKDNPVARKPKAGAKPGKAYKTPKKTK